MELNLKENNGEMYCPRCGGKNELDSPEVKFCRYCGLPIAESRDEARGLTPVKRRGRRYAAWGYVTLQALFLGVLLYLIPTLPLWTSAIFVALFALSNGFFIAGSLAAEKPTSRLLNPAAKKRSGGGSLPHSDIALGQLGSVTEHTTRKLG